MKKAGKIAFGAMMSALSVCVMLGSHFPYLTYAIPAVAGLFIMVVVLELGTRWAWGSYAASALLTLMFAEPEAALFYVLLFGCYPIIKASIQRLKSPFLRFFVKFCLFNAVVAAVYFVLLKVMGIDGGFGGLTLYAVLGIWVLANLVFFIYDAQIVKISNWYMIRFHDRVSKYLKNR